MKRVFTGLLILITINVVARQQTFDLVTYTPPVGWKKEIKESHITYFIVDNKDKAWCQVGIIKSTISKGSIESDFENEWTILAANQYNITEAPQVNEVQEADGWKIKTGIGKFLFNNKDAAAILTTFSGYGVCISIIATTGNQRYLKDIEAFIASVDLKKPVTNAQPSTGIISDNTSIIGTWGKGGAIHPQYNDPVSTMTGGYSKNQYTFNSDGTYTFVSKTFRYMVDKLLLVKESGTFQLNGNNLTITPQKSVIEAWSKKDGTDKWGKLLTTQKRNLEKITYRFTKHYFSGIQIWNLVLQADKVTQRDGPFSSNATFNNAWYYGPITSNNPLIEMPAGQSIKAKKNRRPRTTNSN